MHDRPFFSVVLSTYGRGRHIGPTIESVLAQSFENYELIVVGDGCSDETEATVHSFSSDRIRWLNLPENTGSQSIPNNAGIAEAGGCWIAYIGHDDLWAPHHLEAVFETISRHDSADFIVAGCVFYGPPGSDVYQVSGIFSDDDTPFSHFFPPSSIAHRHNVAARIGQWRDPLTLNMPLDAEFLLRAARAGLRFASTGDLSVHKFAAGHRYLSYLRVESDEQRGLLRRLLSPEGLDTGPIIQRSKFNNEFMVIRYGDFSEFPRGFLFEQNRRNKGIARPTLRPLLQREVMEQSDEPRALDWYGVETGSRKYRWSGPNPHPKILIPLTGSRARIMVEVIAINPAISLGDLRIYTQDRTTPLKTEVVLSSAKYLVFEISLKSNDYTILRLDAPTFSLSESNQFPAQIRRVGIAVGQIVVEPIGFQSLFFDPSDK
jgi:glycosyltransferase involved in cell wall biosynthesis